MCAVPGSTPDSPLHVHSVSDFNLNKGPGLINFWLQRITVANLCLNISPGEIQHFTSLIFNILTFHGSTYTSNYPSFSEFFLTKSKN